MSKKQIGVRLRELRKERGMSLGEVAHATGIAHSTLNMYECGHRTPKDDIKVELAKYYGVSIQELFYQSKGYEEFTSEQKGEKLMNEIMTFENPQFGSFRAMVENGETWFVGNEIARILGYSNPRDALYKHVAPEDKGVAKHDTLGGAQVMTLINESGLYSLILSSKLPRAKEFKRWVTHEVLPSIRKTGGYIAGQESMSDSELLSKALLVAQRQIEQRDKQIGELKPKALFADAVSASSTSVLIGDLAKIISQNGVEIGQKRLFQWMRDNGYLIKQQGTSWNMPTQRAMEMGLMEIKESTHIHSDGHVSISKTPKITGKGQVYFVEKFLKPVKE